MSRSRRKYEPGRKKPRPFAQFAVGNPVCVKPGTPNPDYPEIPLGGWSGTVAAVDQKSSPTIYLVEWNQRTLDQLPPGYRMRCARDGVNVGDMWLNEGHLERDTGELAAIEQPSQIVTRPQVPTVAEDRIRAVFGLISDDPLPAVNAAALRQYHRFLVDHLSFPFAAEFTEESGRPFEAIKYRVQVVALLNPDEADEEEGLLCQVVNGDEEADVPLADLTLKGSSRNRQLVADYSFWFFEESEESIEQADAGEEEQQSLTTRLPTVPSIRTSFRILVMFGIIGIVYGVILGSILGAVEAAASAATLGAALLAVVGGVAGFKIGLLRDPQSDKRLGPVQGGLFLGVAGAVVGALAGATAALAIAAYPGALVGGLLAALIAGWRAPADAAMVRSLLGAAVGAVAGALLLATWRDYESAGVGALYGAGCGAGGAFLLVLTIDACFRWSGWRNRAKNE
jgi:hypothetical protein